MVSNPARRPVPLGGRLGLRILVIDDEPYIVDFVARFLNRSGHSCAAEVSGHRALALLETESFDLVISDVQMPGVSGVDIYRALARRGSDLARRFLLMSGNAGSPATALFLRQTGLRILEKPFTPEALLLAISNLVRTDEPIP